MDNDHPEGQFVMQEELRNEQGSERSDSPCDSDVQVPRLNKQRKLHSISSNDESGDDVGGESVDSEASKRVPRTIDDDDSLGDNFSVEISKAEFLKLSAKDGEGVNSAAAKELLIPIITTKYPHCTVLRTQHSRTSGLTCKHVYNFTYCCNRSTCSRKFVVQIMRPEPNTTTVKATFVRKGVLCHEVEHSGSSAQLVNFSKHGAAVGGSFADTRNLKSKDKESVISLKVARASRSHDSFMYEYRALCKMRTAEALEEKLFIKKFGTPFSVVFFFDSQLKVADKIRRATKNMVVAHVGSSSEVVKTPKWSPGAASHYFCLVSEFNGQVFPHCEFFLQNIGSHNISNSFLEWRVRVVTLKLKLPQFRAVVVPTSFAMAEAATIAFNQIGISDYLEKVVLEIENTPKTPSLVYVFLDVGGMVAAFKDLVLSSIFDNKQGSTADSFAEVQSQAVKFLCRLLLPIDHNNFLKLLKDICILFLSKKVSKHAVESRNSLLQKSDECSTLVDTYSNSQVTFNQQPTLERLPLSSSSTYKKALTVKSQAETIVKNGDKDKTLHRNVYHSTDLVHVLIEKFISLSPLWSTYLQSIANLPVKNYDNSLALDFIKTRHQSLANKKEKCTSVLEKFKYANAATVELLEYELGKRAKSSSIRTPRKRVHSDSSDSSKRSSSSQSSENAEDSEEHDLLALDIWGKQQSPPPVTPITPKIFPSQKKPSAKPSVAKKIKFPAPKQKHETPIINSDDDKESSSSWGLSPGTKVAIAGLSDAEVLSPSVFAADGAQIRQKVVQKDRSPESDTTLKDSEPESDIQGKSKLSSYKSMGEKSEAVDDIDPVKRPSRKSHHSHSPISTSRNRQSDPWRVPLILGQKFVVKKGEYKNVDRNSIKCSRNISPDIELMKEVGKINKKQKKPAQSSQKSAQKDKVIVLSDDNKVESARKKRKKGTSFNSGGVFLVEDDLKCLKSRNAYVNDLVIGSFINHMINDAASKNVGFFHLDSQITEIMRETNCLFRNMLKESHAIDCKIWLLPVNLNKNHWVLYVVDWIGKAITCFDSLHYKDVDGSTGLGEYNYLIGTVLMSAYRMKFEAPLPVREWTLYFPKDTPTQERNDCGPHILYWAQVFCFGERAHVYRPEKMAGFRKTIEGVILRGKDVLVKIPSRYSTVFERGAPEKVPEVSQGRKVFKNVIVGKPPLGYKSTFEYAKSLHSKALLS